MTIASIGPSSRSILRELGVSSRRRVRAGIDPVALDVVEVHDAPACADLIHLEQPGLAEHGRAADLLRDDETSLDGRIPTNVSGGLFNRGHPLGATGCAQLDDRLPDRCGPRQVRHARVALAQNAGGHVGDEEAAVPRVTVALRTESKSAAAVR
jgi:acetyl-CoA acetyltransferase